jgi:predicted transcriptional regulator
MSKTKKETVENTSQKLKNCSEELLKWHDECQRVNKEVEHWQQLFIDTQKDNNEIIETVKELVEQTIENMILIKSVTGELTSVDVRYNLNMIIRLIELKYNEELKQQEQ